MRFVFGVSNLANSELKVKTLWHEMSSWCVYSYMCIQRGLRVACFTFKAMREPDMRNSNNAVPLFLCLLVK